MKIAINDFCRRQTEESEFAHFEGEDHALLELINDNFNKGKQGYREGVLLVPVPPRGFHTSIIPVTKNNVEAVESRFEERQKGEDPYLKHVFIGRAKSPAKSVEIVLYRHDVLAEDNSNTTDAEWEVVSINANPTEESVPMHPVTMARNFLHKEGGTKGEFSAEDFAKAIDFWASHAQRV